MKTKIVLTFFALFSACISQANGYYTSTDGRVLSRTGDTSTGYVELTDSSGGVLIHMDRSSIPDYSWDFGLCKPIYEGSFMTGFLFIECGDALRTGIFAFSSDGSNFP
jgi:hypothetical protein